MLCAISKTIRMIIIELRMCSYNFAYTNINLKGKLQKPFDFFLRYTLACSLVG